MLLVCTHKDATTAALDQVESASDEARSNLTQIMPVPGPMFMVPPLDYHVILNLLYTRTHIMHIAHCSLHKVVYMKMNMCE